MKKELRSLVKEFAGVLANSEEDDFFIAAAKEENAAAVSSKQEVKTPQTAPAPAKSAESVLPAQNNAQTLKEDSSMPAPQTAKTKKTNSNKEAELNALAEQILTCKKCPLGETRLNAVPGEGNANAKLMFIGEGPGFDEDHKGRPFIGRAGTLLTKMIEAMGLKREEVFIANMVKCHPMTDPSNPEKHGNDRAPSKEEIAYCRKYIEAQIALIQPRFIVALGGVAAKSLIKDADSLGALRNKVHTLELDNFDLEGKTKIVATYHPAALLRNPNWKKDAWADLQTVMKEMGLKSPQKSI